MRSGCIGVAAYVLSRKGCANHVLGRLRARMFPPPAGIIATCSILIDRCPRFVRSCCHCVCIERFTVHLSLAAKLYNAIQIADRGMGCTEDGHAFVCMDGSIVGLVENAGP